VEIRKTIQERKKEKEKSVRHIQKKYGNIKKNYVKDQINFISHFTAQFYNFQESLATSQVAFVF